MRIGWGNFTCHDASEGSRRGVAERVPSRSPTERQSAFRFSSLFKSSLRNERNLRETSCAPALQPKVGLTWAGNFPDDPVRDCDAARRNVRGVSLNCVWSPQSTCVSDPLNQPKRKRLRSERSGMWWAFAADQAFRSANRPASPGAYMPLR
jgi:hypothetical protein